MWYKDLLDNMRKYDIVKVTRCKNCILHEDYKSKYNKDFCYCKRFDTFVKSNGFCDCGKDEDVNNV